MRFAVGLRVAMPQMTTHSLKQWHFQGDGQSQWRSMVPTCVRHCHPCPWRPVWWRSRTRWISCAHHTPPPICTCVVQPGDPRRYGVALSILKSDWRFSFLLWFALFFCNYFLFILFFFKIYNSTVLLPLILWSVLLWLPQSLRYWNTCLVNQGPGFDLQGDSFLERDTAIAQRAWGPGLDSQHDLNKQTNKQ